MQAQSSGELLTPTSAAHTASNASQPVRLALHSPPLNLATHPSPAQIVWHTLS